MRQSKWLKTVVAVILAGTVQAQTAAIREMYLYDGPVPHSKSAPDREEKKANEQVDSLAFKVSVPTLTVYFPEKKHADGKVIVVCPGGGYGVLLTKREGSDVARALNRLGYTACVLKYRLPDPEIMEERATGPLQDAQQAIYQVRKHAAEWGITGVPVGIMGFSAGGHLAATAGTHFQTRLIPGEETFSVRPDFMILVNPVISFRKEFGHQGSAVNLLGEHPDQALTDRFSNELHITPDTPPAFLVHASTDAVVPVANSLVFYNGLQREKIPAALHIYSKGEHGFLTYPAFDEWFGRCAYWLETY